LWRAEVLVGGAAEGLALVAGIPLSFWGGVDPQTGDVIDQRHPLRGERLAGRVLVLPRGRGSSSSSSVLLECIRLGTGPAAIVLAVADEMLALGAIVAEELDGRTIPVVVAPPEAIASIRSGDRVEIGPEGDVRVIDAGP
jgi:predicted aconitase with swiveling domain